VEMIRFKSHKDLAYEAFFACRVLSCEEEATKLYSTESNIIDVCENHHKELTEKEYK